MAYVLVLTLVFSNLFAQTEMWSLPSVSTQTVSMYEMCLESDIHQIEELKQSLEENVNQASLNYDSDKQFQSFGLLEEDWKRLYLLESRLPEESVLKPKLIIVFRILLAALYQAHGNKENLNERNAVSSEQNRIEQELSSLSTETLDSGESRNEKVFVNYPYFENKPKQEFLDESTELNYDNFPIPNETSLPTDSVGLTTSLSQILYKTKNYLRDEDETNGSIQGADKVVGRYSVSKETESNHNSFELSDFTNSEEVVTTPTKKENVAGLPVKTNDIYEEENYTTTSIVTSNFINIYHTDGIQHILLESTTDDTMEDSVIPTYGINNEEDTKTVVLNSSEYRTEINDREKYDSDNISSTVSNPAILSLTESTIDTVLNTRSSLNTDIMTDHVTVTTDSWSKNQVYEELDNLINKVDIDFTALVTKMQDTNYSSENGETAFNIDDSSKLKNFKDSDCQTIQETEIDEPTEAASDTIYSFLNFPISTNNKTKENSTSERESLKNSTRDTSTSTKSPISLYDNVLNSLSTPFNEMFVVEDKLTYDSKATNNIYDSQDFSDGHTETPKSKNNLIDLNSERLDLSTFDASEKLSTRYEQSTVTQETHTLKNSLVPDHKELSYNNKSSTSYLEGNETSELTENGNSLYEILNENLSDTSSVTMNTVYPQNRIPTNDYRGPTSNKNTHQITKIPFNISSDDIYSNPHTINITQNSYEKHENNTSDTNDNNKQRIHVGDSRFHLSTTGGSSREISSSLESPYKDLISKDGIMQSSFEDKNEKGILPKDKGKQSNDIKPVSSEQGGDLSIADTEAKSSSLEENIYAILSSGESGETNILHDSRKFASIEEENDMYSPSVIDEDISHEAKITGSNLGLHPFPINDEHISSVEVHTQKNSVENELTSPKNIDISLHENKPIPNSNEQNLSTGDGNKHGSSIEKEVQKYASNSAEHLVRSNEEISSVEDDEMHKNSKEEEGINLESKERSISDDSELPNYTYSHTLKPQTFVTDKSSTVSNIRAEMEDIKDFDDSDENNVPKMSNIKSEDTESEKPNNKDSKEDQLLLETNSNVNFLGGNNKNVAYPEAVNIYDPSGSDSRILSVVKQVPVNVHENTEDPNNSFNTFSIALLPLEENNSPTETYNELNIYPAFEYPYRISNFESSKGCRSTNDCVRVKHIEYKQSDNNFNKRREKRVNPFTYSKGIRNLEERDFRIKYLISQIEDEIWQQKLKAMRNSFVEYPGPPEKQR